MVGVLTVSHGDLGQAMLSSSAMVTGEMRQAKWVGLQPGDEPERFQQEILEAVRELDSGAGVLVLADLRGGTPYNRAAALIRALKLNAKIVAGMNLPMVMVVNLERSETSTLAELAAVAEQAGRDGVYALGDAESAGLDDDMEVEE